MKRPATPAIPYPKEAIQHRRCILALATISMAVSLCKPSYLEEHPDLKRRCESLERMATMCSEETKRKLSKGAERDLKNPFFVLGEYVDGWHGKDDAEQLVEWGSLMWCGMTFLEDCRNTCPVYFKGLLWYNLLRSVTALCDGMAESMPEIADIGTDLYMRAE